MDKIRSILVRSHIAILLFTSLSIKGFSADTNKVLSGLQQELKSVPDKERLTFIENYGKRHTEDENYREILRLYEEEAVQRNDNHHLANALTMLGRYYYPEHTDSLFMVIKRLEPIVNEIHEYTEYIEIWALYNYSLVWEGKSEEMEESIKALKDFSRKESKPKGLELADLNMAY